MDLSEHDEAVYHAAHRKVNMQPQIEIPRYQQIAYDVAGKIAKGAYAEGTKIYARSALASQYGVSSETARRAICVLSDLGIVESAKGSGITIISSEKAVEFVRQFTNVDAVSELRRTLRESIQRQQSEMQNINLLLDRLMDRAERFNASNPFVPYQIKLPVDCLHLGKSLRELNFWHNTMATVVAIQRKDELILSPGPFEALQGEDIVYYIGNEDCVARVHRLLLACKE